MADNNSLTDAILGPQASSQYWGSSADNIDKSQLPQVINDGPNYPHAQTGQQANTQNLNDPNSQTPQTQPTGQQTPGTPVTANGQIPAYTPPPVPAAPTYQAPAAPTSTSYQNDARYIAPTAAQVTYDPLTFSAPSNQSTLEGGQNSLINAILANPDTLNPNVVAQMKEQQKEQALLLGQQNLASALPGLLARGVGTGGQVNALKANNDANVNSSILTGNRAVDLSAAATNRQNELDALTAADSVGNNQLSRASTVFGTNANQQQLAYQSKAKANDDAAARAAAIAANAQGNYGQDVQQNQFATNLAEQQNEFARQLGLNYDNLNLSANNSQNALIAAIMNG